MKEKNLQILKQNNFNVPDFDVIKWEDKDKEINLDKYEGHMQ